MTTTTSKNEDKQAKLLSIAQKELSNYIMYAAKEIQETEIFSDTFIFANTIAKMAAIYGMIHDVQLDSKDIDFILTSQNPLRLMSAVWKTRKDNQEEQKANLAVIIENLHKTPGNRK